MTEIQTQKQVKKCLQHGEHKRWTAFLGQRQSIKPNSYSTTVRKHALKTSLLLPAQEENMILGGQGNTDEMYRADPPEKEDVTFMCLASKLRQITSY